MRRKEPYRILIIHNYYQIPGGEDTVVSNEKRLLEEHGQAAFFYMRNNREMGGFSIFQRLWLPVQTVFSFKTYFEVKHLIREEHIDLVHVHNTWNLISPSVYYAAFRCKVPVVQTIHNFRLLCPAATFVKKSVLCEDCIKKGLTCSVKGRCYRNSRLQTLASAFTLKVHRIAGTYGKLYYICLTKFNKEKLLQINGRGKQLIAPERVLIKPNFTWTEKSPYPSAKRKNQFLYVGRLDALKGIRLLLEAWSMIKDFKLLICGGGAEESWIEAFLEENHIDNVQLLGQTNHEQVLKLLQESKALIMPSQWYEGQPMVILESYSVGTPVLGSRLGNVKDMIEEGITGCTFSHDKPEELCSIIQNFPKFDEDVIRRHFDKNYGSEQNYKKLMDIYEQAIKDVHNEKSSHHH
ncbi:MAG: glycosyltransferase family 4 protein [Lachnospiraceae bacterium]|nr:glycosyltransferase family 4 protein [Lachnospiraceae bacterium]